MVGGGVGFSRLDTGMGGKGGWASRSNPFLYCSSNKKRLWSNVRARRKYFLKDLLYFFSSALPPSLLNLSFLIPDTPYQIYTSSSISRSSFQPCPHHPGPKTPKAARVPRYIQSALFNSGAVSRIENASPLLPLRSVQMQELWSPKDPVLSRILHLERRRHTITCTRRRATRGIDSVHLLYPTEIVCGVHVPVRGLCL